VDVDGLCSATFFNAQALASAARRFLLQIDHQKLVATRIQVGGAINKESVKLTTTKSKRVGRRLVHVRLQLDQRTLDRAIRKSGGLRILLDLYSSDRRALR